MSDLPTTPGNGAAKPAERRVRHGLIEDWRDAVGILLLLLVAAFFGALITRFWPEADEAAPAADVAARLSALEAHQSPREFATLKDRIAKLEARLRAAEVAVTAAKVGGDLAATAFGAMPGGPTPASALASLQTARKQVDDLGARLAALEAKLATTPDDVKGLAAKTTDLGTKVDGFAERLAKLEDSDLLEMARRASLATAIANLSRAAEGSAPFKREYDVVAALAPNDPRLADIGPLAAKGAPTANTLMATFGDLAVQALNAEEAAKAQGWFAHLWLNFTSLISVRKVGEIGDNTNEGRLARAGVRLKGGDLGAVMRELNAIEGPAREPLKPWMAQADARLKLQAALADLNTRAIEAITAPAGGATEPVPQLPNP